MRTSPSLSARECPGGSSRMFSKKVLGGRLTQKVKISFKPAASTRRATRESAKIALISEPKIKAIFRSDVLKKGPGRQIDPESENLIQAGGIDAAGHAGIGEDRFNFGAKNKSDLQI